MSSSEANNLDCHICRKHQGKTPTPGRVIFQDDLVYAGHADLDEGEDTTYLGHLMIEPRRHAPGLADLTNKEAQALGLLITRLSRALQASEKAEHVYAFVFGHHIPHLHVHLVPRYPGTPREYWGVRVDEWPDAPRGGREQVAKLCERLTVFISREISQSDKHD